MAGVEISYTFKQVLFVVKQLSCQIREWESHEVIRTILIITVLIVSEWQNGAISIPRREVQGAKP